MKKKRVVVLFIIMYQKGLKIRKRILISGIGGEIAQGASRIIRENFPSCEIHVSDCESRHSGKLFADKLLKLPKTSLKQLMRILD